MKRRSLLGAMLAACAAPAFVKASSLMPLYIPAPCKVWTPDHRLIPLGEGELRLYDGSGNVLASIGLGNMEGGIFKGNGIAMRSGLAKTCTFDIPGGRPWTTSVGGPGSNAGFQMNTTALMMGGPLLIDGRLKRMQS